MRRVNVSTHCPMCAAPIDFHAGVNALECTHCRSKLLVTGRKQLLSYSVTPKIGAHAAVNRARPAAEGARIITIELYFVPYYRFTAQEFYWQTPPAKPPKEAGPFAGIAMSDAAPWGGGSDSEAQIDLVGAAFGWLANLVFPPAPAEEVKIAPFKPAVLAGTPHRSSDVARPVKGIEIAERHIEKTFVANHDLEGRNLYSLGARTSVLRLDLFRRPRLETMGRVVAPTMTADEAIGRGTMRTTPDILYREVVGRVLSLIYFPYWVVEIDRDGEPQIVVIDGISGSIVQRDAPVSLYEILNRRESGDPETLGFRPLRCPNCRDELPMRPDDVVFFCGTCERAWQISGSEMNRVPHKLAATAGMAGKPGTFLPFWVFEHAGDAKHNFFIPAFRYPGLQALFQMAARLSASSPQYGEAPAQSVEACNCFYDEEDALRLAKVAYLGQIVKRPEDLEKLSRENLPVAAATLTWFPFEKRGQMLIDPFLGQFLYGNLLA